MLLCWAAYTAAYIGRLNLNAFIEPLRTQLDATKTDMGLVSSFFYFSYGAGQLLHGILSRKYNTRYSVAVALVGSAAVNIAMTFCTSAEVMKYVWFFNGFFQSILWSSIIKTLSDRLPDELIRRSVVIMSTPVAIGTFLAYGMSAVLSEAKADYRLVFYIPSAILLAVGVLWFFLIKRADFSSKKEDGGSYAPQPKKRPAFTAAFVIGAVLLMAAAIANGFIKDGVTTWMPSILKEDHGLKESLSIFITVFLPLVAVVGAIFSTALHKKQSNTSILDGGLYFAEIIVLSLVLFVTSRLSGKTGTALFILLFAVSAMLMSAVNNVITGIIPMYMRDKMDSGLLAGVLDTFCYVGSTLSTGLLGYIADKGSWNGVFVCLLIFSVAACVTCVISVLIGRKNHEIIA